MTQKSECRGSAAKAATLPVAETAAAVRADEAALLTDLRTLIRSARQRLVTAVDATHTLLRERLHRAIEHARESAARRVRDGEGRG